ncbi:MAG: glycosyltransferase family A protein [Planctomycetota bacterium]
MKLSVIVPARDAAATLPRCLEAVAAILAAGDELVVVDDGSKDSTAVVAQRYGARVVSRTRPAGPAAARNLGAGEASGDVLLFVDADVVIPPGSRERIEAALSAPDLAAAVGILGEATETRDFASRYENHYMHWAYRSGPDFVPIFYTSAGAIRAAVFRALGGFDEGYRHPSVEDMDLGVRLALAGSTPRVLMDLQVLHLKTFGLLGLLRVNRRKATATLRLRWRHRHRQPPGSVASGGRFVAGIPFTVAAGGLLGASLSGAPGFETAGLWGSLACFALALLLRWPFLRYLADREGVGFALAALPLLLANDVAYSVGLGVGVAGWIAGRRH